MKRSTARRNERKARRDEKHAAINTIIPDPIDGKGWTIHPGACLVRWEDAPEPPRGSRTPIGVLPPRYPKWDD